MRYILTAILTASVLTACASSKDLKPPKALPANWQMETAPMPGRYSEASWTDSKTGHTVKTNRPGAQMTSLWSSSPKSLFGDRRANQLGDILTVVIEIDEEAKLQNSVTTDRTNNRNMEVASFFGLPEVMAGILPAGASLKPAADVTGSDNMSGQGNITRTEKLTLRLAARVNAVLPNGYLGVVGRQEVMVNNEVRYLQVTGLVRIADISRLNTITYDKIAEARIFYGGRGQITTATEQKAGSKVLGKILPF